MRSRLSLLCAGIGLSCRAEPGDRVVDVPVATSTTTCSDPALTWEGFAQPFLMTWCTSCHGGALTGDARHGAPPGLDFDTLAGTAPYAASIRSVAVDAVLMPPTDAVPLEDRARLGAWIACGLPGPDVAAPVLTFCDAPVFYDGDVVASAPPTGACADWNAITGDATLDQVSSSLDCLCEIGGDLVATAPGDVVLPELTRVGGDVRAVGASGLTRFEAPYLSEVDGSIVVTDDAALTAIHLPRLTRVGGGLSVARAPLLTDLSSMRSVDTVGGSVAFIDLDALVTLDALAVAVTIDGAIEVTGNAELTTLWIGDNLVENTGGISLTDNASLASVGGLTDLAVAGDITLRGLPALVALPTLASLKNASSVTVAETDALTSLAGLDNLRTLTGSLEVTANRALLDIDPLRGVESITGDLIVTDNPLLPTSDVATLVEAIGVENITGVIEESGNGPG